MSFFIRSVYLDAKWRVPPTPVRSCPPSNRRHAYGTFAAGRDNNPGKLSAGCQFYVVHAADGIPRLDDNYTIYGHVFKGMDVVDAIVTVETDEADEPLTMIELDVNIIEISRTAIESSGFTIPSE